MHLKRQKVPKTWPVPRKGTAYVVRPQSNLKTGIPLLVVFRDMLKLVQNRKEMKKAIHLGHILLNSKKIKNEKNCVLLFDVITIAPSKENYRLNLTGKGRFKLEKIDEKESTKKISKIINKKILEGKKMQLNLSDGRNIISGIKCRTNDSVLIDLKKNNIEKCLQLKEKTKALVIGGKHIGKTGVIDKINQEKKIVEIMGDEKQKVNVLIKHLIVVGENDQQN